MDWKTLIAELVASGMTQREIAKDCDLGQATVSEIASGRIKDLRWTSGERLRMLHAKRVVGGSSTASITAGAS